jgi:hypothetical protein
MMGDDVPAGTVSGSVPERLAARDEGQLEL